MEYESFAEVKSQIAPGIRFVVAKMSFGRRLELMRQIRELAGRMEFSIAGKSSQDQMDAALLAMEIDRLYLTWGLQEVRGLKLDGTPASPEMLAIKGPEDLFREAVAAVKAECGLSEEQRKN